MGDKRKDRRIATLANRLLATDDNLDRARLAAELRYLAESIVASSIRDANRRGMTWRQIGAELGITFQTLYRRYGAE